MASAEPGRPPKPGAPAKPATGLRERKKQKTKEAIQRAAMRLFLKQGYEETTIEQIAAAVEISPSTFFNYFPTKEDVIIYDAYDPLAIEMFLERPTDEPLNVAVRQVVAGLAIAFERDEELLLARGRLMMEVPELRARIGEELERTQVMVATMLAERTGRSRNDFEVRVTARVLTGAMYEAALEWMRRNGRESLARLMNRALDVVESGAPLSALPASKSPRAPARR